MTNIKPENNNLRTVRTAGGIFYQYPEADGKAVPAVYLGRIGGASRPPYEGLNLGLRTSEDRRVVEENYRLVGKRFGVEKIFTAHQVHADSILTIERGADPKETAEIKADALISVDGDAVGVLTADCFPLLIYGASLSAAVHCGWRPTAAGLPLKVVNRLRDMGERPEKLIFGIGAGIGGCCFEVGDEVFNQFGRLEFYRAERRLPDNKLDLQGVIFDQLLFAGADPANIYGSGFCTRCDRELFYSHRGGDPGRQLSFVGRNIKALE